MDLTTRSAIDAISLLYLESITTISNKECDVREEDGYKKGVELLKSVIRNAGIMAYESQCECPHAIQCPPSFSFHYPMLLYLGLLAYALNREIHQSKWTLLSSRKRKLRTSGR
jgi:hypothetical protein